jgi:DNA-binding YbaB/EbfC family protein
VNISFPGMFGGHMMKLVQGWMETQRRVMEEMEELRVEASVGGGAVKATANGMGKLLEIEIAPDVIEGGDAEMLQDLVVTAVQEVVAKAEEAQREKGFIGLNPSLLSGIIDGQAPTGSEA